MKSKTLLTLLSGKHLQISKIPLWQIRKKLASKQSRKENNPNAKASPALIFSRIRFIISKLQFFKKIRAIMTKLKQEWFRMRLQN